MSSNRDRRHRPSSSDRYTVLAQVVLVLSSLVAVLATLLPRFAPSTGALIDLGIGVLVAVYLVSAVFVARRILRTRYYDFRIALTGQPKAGKTVFANLLYDQLMNGNDPDFEFTAESKSAIATYQAIRGIAQNEWPPSTTQGAVLQHDGALRHRRIVVELEIGDSAGQHWLSLSTAANQDPDYTQWVLSAQALVHVIPADRLVAEGVDSTLRADVEDLRLAAQLMRSVSKGKYVPVPILIVISKMDKLRALVVEQELMRIFTGTDADELKSTRSLTELGMLDVGDLLQSLTRELVGDFRSVDFTYSSADVLTRSRTLGAPRRPDVAKWIIANASAGVVSPLQRIVLGR